MKRLVLVLISNVECFELDFELGQCRKQDPHHPDQCLHKWYKEERAEDLSHGFIPF